MEDGVGWELGCWSDRALRCQRRRENGVKIKAKTRLRRVRHRPPVRKLRQHQIIRQSTMEVSNVLTQYFHKLDRRSAQMAQSVKHQTLDFG